MFAYQNQQKHIKAYDQSFTAFESITSSIREGLEEFTLLN